MNKIAKILILAFAIFSFENLFSNEKLSINSNGLKNTLGSKKDDLYQKKKPYSSNSKQCKGIALSTKVRCRNMTKNTNGYCRLHS